MRNLNLNMLSLLILLISNSCLFSSAKKERFEEDLSKANVLYEKGEYKSALIIFDSLIEKDSLNGEINYKRGYCKAQTSDTKTSKKDFKNAIRFNYKVKDAYLNLGVLECFYNDSLAIKYFDIALNMDSTDEKAKTYREEAIKRLNKYNNIIEI